MADPLGSVESFFSSILRDPVYLLLTIGAGALFILLLVVHRIHKIHSEEIFVHQAWGSNWKGREPRNPHIRTAVSRRLGGVN
jgi:hypothetical protein